VIRPNSLAAPFGRGDPNALPDPRFAGNHVILVSRGKPPLWVRRRLARARLGDGRGIRSIGLLGLWRPEWRTRLEPYERALAFTYEGGLRERSDLAQVHRELPRAAAVWLPIGDTLASALLRLSPANFRCLVDPSTPPIDVERQFVAGVPPIVRAVEAQILGGETA
jgi:hypothetical protein